jgi:hypothetical protein
MLQNKSKDLDHLPVTARVLEKMQLKNNAEITHYAIKHGLVE